MDDRDRNRELLAINRAIASAESFDEILQRVVERTAAFTRASACLLLLAKDGGLARVVRSVGLDPVKAGQLAIPLSERIDGELGELLGLTPEDRFLGVPVIGRGGLMGVLAVYHRGLHAVDAAEDEELLSALADQAAIALDNAERVRRLEEGAAVRRHAERLEHLQGFTSALASALTPGDVAEVVFRRGLALLGTDVAAISTVVDGRELEVSYRHGLELPASGPERAPLDAGFPVTEAARTGIPVWAESAAELADRFGGRLLLRAAEPFRAMAHVPLRGNSGGLLGVLSIGYARPRVFSEEDRAFIGLVANQCALALDRARLHAAEAAARRDEERARKLQERLMAIVGHDLRTPLSAISTAVTLLYRRGELSEAQGATLARIASSAARMNGIIRDVLDFSRARQGLGLAIQREPVDLGEVARKALLEFEDAHGEGRLSLAVGGEVQLQGDPGRLWQVVSNLVSNGLRYGAGAPVRVGVSGRERDVLLEVQNDGPPIHPAVLPHLFEPFRRGVDSDPESERTGSIGLGLFIVHGVVKAHGGAVEVRSGPGTGTTFRLTLPRTPDH